jgi:hypothetical protein
MAKYKIISYKKKEQSFLSSINSIDHTTGGISEPYEIKLEKFSFFGLIKSKVTKNVSLPRGFNHKKELTKGREWVG